MPSFPGCYKPSPDRKRILCPVFSRVQQQNRQQCNFHAAAPTVLFVSDLSTTSLAESSPHLNRGAAPGLGRAGSC